MSEAILTEPLVTIAAFDAFLDSQQDDSLWELVAGRIVAMTNPTEVPTSRSQATSARP